MWKHLPNGTPAPVTRPACPGARPAVLVPVQSPEEGDRDAGDADYRPLDGIARQAGEHRVPATLLQGVPSGSDSFAVVSLGWARARWAVPGGSVRTGYVEAPAGSRAGSTVRVWLDRSGAPTEPPWPPDQIRSWTLMIAVLAPVLLALLLLAVMGILGHVFHRRRLASWQRAWSAIGPQWTRRPR